MEDNLLEAIGPDEGLECIRYSLKAVYNEATQSFDYCLKAHLPSNGQDVTIQLSPELVHTLSSHWKQNEYGTFLGKHNMAWIITHLTAGEKI